MRPELATADILADYRSLSLFERIAVYYRLKPSDRMRLSRAMKAEKTRSKTRRDQNRNDTPDPLMSGPQITDAEEAHFSDVFRAHIFKLCDDNGGRIGQKTIDQLKRELTRPSRG